MNKVLPKLVRYGLSCAVGAMALSLTTQRVHAATINIQGTVAAVANLTASAATPLTDTDLTEGIAAKTISTVNERCNKHNGYTVTLESANAKAASSPQARMNPATTGNSDTIDYTILYNGSSVTLNNSGAATVTDASGKTTKSGVDKVLAVTVAAGNPAQDTYSDTLTLTIAAK
ncbi:MAG: spore coat protein U domain-containing protein [Verrucomicrobia bacterium]|nr:spore coat protein U domain-containing protein [Verrucomicrobiota bacterium]